MENYINKVKKIAENLSWTVTIDDDHIDFQTYTTYGQDCNFRLTLEETFEEFCDSLYEFYNNFDCSYETYLWLGNDGHGTNGAPYDMMDVYNDMKEYEEEIYKLYKEIEIAYKGDGYVYLTDEAELSAGEMPEDMSCPEDADTAIEYSLPRNFSDKAKAFWKYLDDTAFIFEYKGDLVITDESLQLREYTSDLYNLAPRWTMDSWEELEKMLELCYNEHGEEEMAEYMEAVKNETL